jgi:hypothetical protein
MTEPLVPKDQTPSLPTDAQLDAELQRAGFTHCLDKPYWWTLQAKPPMLRLLSEAPYPAVEPIRKSRKKRGMGK